MPKLSLLLFIAAFPCAQLKCTNESYGLYCENIAKEDGGIFMNFSANYTAENWNIKAVFLKNSSVRLKDEDFLLFPSVKSLDIQYCSIDDLMTSKTDLANLYLMHNWKFPKLTAEFLKKCCENLKILYIVDNTGISIENEAFKHLNQLKHLTISKQLVKELAKAFLEGLNKLIYLNLKENGIESLKENAFEDLTALKYLILSDNKISKFEPETFTSLIQLESFEFLGLDLKEFDISIFSKQKELKSLGLPTKLIKNIQLDQLSMTFKNLQTIILSRADKNNEIVNKFILECEDRNFTVKFT